MKMIQGGAAMVVIALPLLGCARSTAVSPRDKLEATMTSATATSFDKAVAFGELVDRDLVSPGGLTLDEFASMLHVTALQSDLDGAGNEYFFSLCDGDAARSREAFRAAESTAPARTRPWAPRDDCSWMVVVRTDDQRRVVKYWLYRSQR